ncbi:MAG: thiamine-phosphate kinase [Pseudomonadota bacterium]
MSEFDWIKRYFAPLAASQGASGLRDDVAELSRAEGRMIATVDAVVEGVHFLPGADEADVAAKLVAVNASDIRVKGGRPCEALLTLGWPQDRGEDEISAFAAALGGALADVGAVLVGGDTVTSPHGIFASLTLTGECAQGPTIRRSGARPGDDVWLSGEIGHGMIGLADAQRQADTASARHYLRPRIISQALSDRIAQEASASLDVSDGLLGDALKLAEASGVQLRLELNDVPLADPACEKVTLIEQVTGGEDFCALFTAPAGRRAKLETWAEAAGERLARIGATSTGSGLALLRGGNPQPLPEKLGFTHGQ